MSLGKGTLEVQKTMEGYPHTVWEEDALTFLKQMQAGAVHAVISDPPYDFSKEKKDEFHFHMQRVSRGPVIVFMAPENLWQPENVPDQTGFWIKPTSTKNVSKRYSRFVEVIQFFKGEFDYWDPKGHWSQYTNVFNEIVESTGWHPYQKPVSLMERLVRNHTHTDHWVLDPFCGSGTTGVACKRMGRNFIGVEKKYELVHTARERIKNSLV